MSCEQIANELTLYHYGELTQEDEERVEHHLAACPACFAELGRVRALQKVMMIAQAGVPPGLLESCRLDLSRKVRGASQTAKTSWLSRLQSFMNMGIGMRIPAGALALVALGFVAGKIAPFNLPGFAGTQQAGFLNVRSLEPDGKGGIRIGVDNVAHNTVSGSLDDRTVRELLISSVHNDSNAGLRITAVTMLKDHADSPEIRGALAEALLHDPNIGVRVEAVEALRPYSADPAVRPALIEALLNDSNAGVRVKVIDLLTGQNDPSLVGTLQTAVQKENNTYIRARASNALREMHASAGAF